MEKEVLKEQEDEKSYIDEFLTEVLSRNLEEMTEEFLTILKKAIVEESIKCAKNELGREISRKLRKMPQDKVPELEEVKSEIIEPLLDRAYDIMCEYANDMQETILENY